MLRRCRHPSGGTRTTGAVLYSETCTPETCGIYYHCRVKGGQSVAPPNRTEIDSFKGFVEIIEARMAASGRQLWYRGVGREGYRLTPSLYRHPTRQRIEELMALEAELLQRFRHRSIPFLTRELKDCWELFFFGQHYGLPTRLLDWTENPFIALYFALTFAPHHYDSGKIVFEEDAAIWILDPEAWNGHALRHISFSGILGAGDDALNGYQPASDVRRLNKNPVALHAMHNSQRIVAQRGTFTIFGSNTAPMERIFDEDGFPADSLEKVVLLQASLAGIFSSLLKVGITDSVVFPDVEGLAKELKRFFCFEV